MKSRLIFSFLLFLISHSLLGQTMQSEVYTYDASGYRIKRECKIYQFKHGKQPIDTLIQQDKKSDYIIKSYPNPTTDMVTIESLNWDEKNNVVVKLYDVSGKIIYSKLLVSAKDNIPFSGVAPGTYQVSYYLNNRLLTTWKIIKL
jgi:hypothetical protein